MDHQTYGIHAAKTQLSQLIEQALAGQEVIITRNGEAVVRLQAIRKEAKLPRIGALKGIAMPMDEEASNAMDKDIEALFEGRA